MTVGQFLANFGWQVGKFLLFCASAVFIAGVVAWFFFEDAKKEDESHKKPPQPMPEPERRVAA